MYVDSSDPMSSRGASLHTPYLEATEALCVEFALSIQGKQTDVGSISVAKLHASGARDTVWTANTLTIKEWDLEFINLGTGVFQLEFYVRSPGQPEGDIAIDDVSFGPCQLFGTFLLYIR